MIISILPQRMLSASAATTTIFFLPSEAWSGVGGRYAVHYMTDSYDGWVDVSKASVEGYYSVSIPEGASFEFCLMLPDSTENIDVNVMHRSNIFSLPTDVNKANCLRLHDGIMDVPDGDWVLIEGLSVSAATTIFFRPSKAWSSEGGRYAVHYKTDSYEGWVDVSKASVEGDYSVSIPECLSFEFCLMSLDSIENVPENVMHSSSTFSLPTDVNEANCLILHDD